MDDVTAPGPLRVFLFGMRCRSTMPVAEALIADPGVEVVGVVVPGSGPHPGAEDHSRANAPVAEARPPRNSPPSPRIGRGAGGEGPLDDLLRRNNISLAEAASVRKRELAPLLVCHNLINLDAIVVACFPWRLPRWLRDLPRLGALNVHPSLLPALRGPEPEFWALRLGMRQTGVTIHLMDEELDTGPVVLQRTVPIPADVTLPALETLLASAGGGLIREALRRLDAGDIAPRPQAGVPSYAPNPNPYDLAVSTDLPAGWAARSARAIMPVYGPLPVLVPATGQRLLVDGVLGVDEGASLPAPVEEAGETVAVRFRPGVVWFHRVPV